MVSLPRFNASCASRIRLAHTLPLFLYLFQFPRVGQITPLFGRAPHRQLVLTLPLLASCALLAFLPSSCPRASCATSSLVNHNALASMSHFASTLSLRVESPPLCFHARITYAPARCLPLFELLPRCNVCTNCEAKDASFRVQFFLVHSIDRRSCMRVVFRSPNSSYSSCLLHASDSSSSRTTSYTSSILVTHASLLLKFLFWSDSVLQ